MAKLYMKLLKLFWARTRRNEETRKTGNKKNLRST